MPGSGVNRKHRDIYLLDVRLAAMMEMPGFTNLEVDGKEKATMDESREELEKKMAEELEKKIAEDVEKRVTEAVTTGVPILISVAIAFGITVVVLKFVWAWVVPDLFPGAVAQGLINADLTWAAAVKFAVLVAVLSGVYQTLTDAFKRK
jgi:hypothetical protein